MNKLQLTCYYADTPIVLYHPSKITRVFVSRKGVTTVVHDDKYLSVKETVEDVTKLLDEHCLVVEWVA